MIVQAAKDELKKVQIKQVADLKARERAERDAKIALKRQAEGQGDDQDASMA